MTVLPYPHSKPKFSDENGYKQLVRGGVYHRWAKWEGNDFFLRNSCGRDGLLPRAGAKLRSREDLPDGAKVCKNCEERV